MTGGRAHPGDLTWVGHATVLVETAGIRLLTDPTVTLSVAHLRRRRPLPVLPPVDVVLVSHLHMDHFHRPSLRQVIGERTHVVVPAGSRPLLRGTAARTVDEVHVGDRLAVGATGGVTVDVVHAEHSGRRGPHSRLVAPALGYVVRAGDRTVYFAGDTDLFDGMADIGPVDVALLPIWGWGPTLGERHLDPVTAATAAQRLQARHVVAIHWGTYSPVRLRRGAPAWLDHPLGAFHAALADHGIADRLVTLWPGTSMPLPSATG